MLFEREKNSKQVKLKNSKLIILLKQKNNKNS